MPFGSGKAALLRQPRFWTLQFAGWLLILPLYFRETIGRGIREGLAPLMLAGTAVGCAMAIVCSSALAAAYLALPPRWLTRAGSIPLALAASLLAAVPMTTVMSLLVASMTSGVADYVAWIFFHAFMLMAVWSAAFLWFVRKDRARKPQIRLTDASALEPELPDPKDPLLARAQSPAASPATQTMTGRWTPDERVCLEEAHRVRFWPVHDIAYIRAARNHTEVHLSNGEVANVKERLQYWESRLPESFVRIHRSTLVNLELSEELEHVNGAWHVRLRGWQEPLGVSRRLEKGVRAKFIGKKVRLST